MSLKAFHTFFIVISFIFATYFGGWCFSQYSASGAIMMLAGTFASFFAATGLSLYLIWFLRKTKKIGFLVIGACWLLLQPEISWACSVCSGDPNSAMVKSVNLGVWFLLGVVGVMLSAFASLFLLWRKRESAYALVK